MKLALHAEVDLGQCAFKGCALKFGGVHPEPRRGYEKRGQVRSAKGATRRLAHRQFRKILEAGSIQIAAQNCGTNDIVELRSLVEAQRSKLGDNKAFIEADIAFHVAIARMTDNPLIQAVTQAMLSWLSAYYKPLLHWSGREDTTLLEHARLIDLMENNDVSGAMSLMEEHLNRSSPLYEPD